MIDRLPPHSSEAEAGLLGCVLISPNEVMAECLSRIGSLQVFYDLRHQTVWKKMVEMYGKEAIDVITLQERLRAGGTLEMIGGIAFLAGLPDTVPSAVNAAYYLDIVMEKYVLRRMIQACVESVDRVYNHTGQVPVLIDEIQREVLKVGNELIQTRTVPIKVLVCDAIGKIEAMHQSAGKIMGISTGFPDLDGYTDGLHPGEMIVIAAYPSVGKTALAMNIAEHVALEQKLPVGIFSLEMSASSLIIRSLCSVSRTNLRQIRKGYMTERDFPRLTNAAGRIAGSRMHIEDVSDLSIEKFRGVARQLWRLEKVSMFVVDYIQLLSAARNENRQEEVAAISRGIKAIARECNVPVIALSQLNDDGKLRESRAIGQDADSVWMLERDGQGTINADPINLWIRKQRNGPANVCVKLVFMKEFTRFESVVRTGANHEQ